MARVRLLGSETPRLFTPPLRPLRPAVLDRAGNVVEPATSWGFSVIEFAEAIGVDLLPWQRWLLIHALEIREDGTLRFRYVLVLVARQNGKSTVAQVLALWWIFVNGVRLVLGTAQDLDTAEEVWEGAVALAEEDPELSDQVKRVVRVNGKKSLDLVTGERYKVKAASRKSGRGLSAVKVILDELREHHTWESWAAITKTTRAKPDAQIWALSNAGDALSVVLRHLRVAAHRVLGDPDGVCAQDPFAGPSQFDIDSFPEDDDDLDGVEVDDLGVDEDDLALFEWSTNPARDKWDRQGWAESNPALGHLITERTIASECRKDPDPVFRAEVLCQWPDGTSEGPFPPGSWEHTTNPVVFDPSLGPTLAPAARIVGRVWACVDQSHDRSQTWVSFAGRRADGRMQAEVVAGRRGTDWVRGWLMDPKRRDRIVAVTGQSRGAPVSPLMTRLEEAARDVENPFTIPIVPWAGGDLLAAFGEAFDAVRDGQVWHNPQPVLDRAAATAATKALGDGLVIERRRSPADAAPLVSWIGALWLARQAEVIPPPPPPAPRALAVAEARTPTDDLATAGF